MIIYYSYSVCDTAGSNCCGTSSLHTSYNHRWSQVYVQMASFLHDWSSGCRPFCLSTSWWPGKLCRVIALSWKTCFLFFPRYRFIPQKPAISCLASSSLNCSRECRALEDMAWRERRSRMNASVIDTSNKNQSKYLHHFLPGWSDG